MSMKNLLRLFLTLFVAAPCFAAPPVSTVWEKAALGTNPAITQVTLYGFNGTIAATFEAAWPESATYAPLSAAMSAPYCASTDANDTSAGTGARTVSIGGETTAFARFSETISTNGQTSVVLATANILLIDTMEVLTAGSGGLNAGIIRCGTGTNTAGVPAVVHSHMAISSATAVAGNGNKSTMFIYGVPASRTLICRNIAAGSVFATAAASLQVAIDGYTNAGLLKRYFFQHIHNTGANPSLYTGLMMFPEKTIVVGKLAGPTGSNTGPADLRAECISVHNDYLNQPESVF